MNLPPSTRIFAGVQDVGIPSDLLYPLPALTRGVNELLVKDFSIQGGRQVQPSFYNTINNKYKLIIIFKTSFLVGIECLDHYTNNHHKLHSHLRNGHLRHLENFQIIDHDLVHIAPLDGDHKMTGRLTGYGKTIDIRYRPTDEHLFSSTRSHEHHENSQHPYDMESSNFKDYDCLYKGKDLSLTISTFTVGAKLKWKLLVN